MPIYSKYQSWAYQNILKHSSVFKILTSLQDAADKYEEGKNKRMADEFDIALLEGITFGFYVQARMAFHSACLLLEFGFPYQAKHLSRALFELHLDLEYMHSGQMPDVLARARRFASYEGAYRYDFMKKAPKLTERLPQDWKDLYRGMWEKHVQKFPDGDLKHWSGLTVQERLKKLGRADDYEMYRLLSQAPHASPFVLGGFMRKTDSGISFLQGPTDELMESTSLEIGSLFLRILDMNVQFSRYEAIDLTLIHKEIERLGADLKPGE